MLLKVRLVFGRYCWAENPKPPWSLIHRTTVLYDKNSVHSFIRFQWALIGPANKQYSSCWLGKTILKDFAINAHWNLKKIWTEFLSNFYRHCTRPYFSCPFTQKRVWLHKISWWVLHQTSHVHFKTVAFVINLVIIAYRISVREAHTIQIMNN